MEEEREDRRSMPGPYPEHERMMSVRHLSQTIGEFLEWYRGSGGELGRWVEDDDCPLLPDGRSVQAVLADYFGIDLGKIEEEKIAILEEFRAEALKG